MSPGFKCGIQLAWYVAEKSDFLNLVRFTAVVLWTVHFAPWWLCSSGTQHVKGDCFSVLNANHCRKESQEVVWIYMYIYRLFATRVSQLKIWHLCVTGMERNVCRCNFNRYSVITYFAKLAAGEQLCQKTQLNSKMPNFELWHVLWTVHFAPWWLCSSGTQHVKGDCFSVLNANHCRKESQQVVWIYKYIECHNSKFGIYELLV